MDCFAALAMTDNPYALNASGNRTGSPVDDVIRSPCHNRALADEGLTEPSQGLLPAP
jgi:hypothetical protein